CGPPRTHARPSWSNGHRRQQPWFRFVRGRESWGSWTRSTWALGSARAPWHGWVVLVLVGMAHGASNHRVPYPEAPAPWAARARRAGSGAGLGERPCAATGDLPPVVTSVKEPDAARLGIPPPKAGNWHLHPAIAGPKVNALARILDDLPGTTSDRALVFLRED